MKLIPNIDMGELTRLTREGRLSDAMALLVRPKSAPTTSNSTPASGRDSPTTFRHGAKVGIKQGGFARPAGSGQDAPDAVRSILERIGRPGSSPLCGMTAPFKHPSVLVPDGASFDERIFSNDAGSRSYKLYTPSGANGRLLPLVVMLHGCTQSPDDFAAGTRMNELAEEHTFLVAYPAQPRSANAQKCWNWFSASDHVRDWGEPSLIAGITRQIMSEIPVDPGRVFIAGLSAGGAAAAVMGSLYPDLYAAVGVHSGLAYGAATDTPSAFAAMRRGAPHLKGRRPQNKSRRSTRVIVFHGDADKTVHPVNGDQVIAQFESANGLRKNVTHGQSPGGMTYTRTVQTGDSHEADAEQWILHGAGHAWSGGSSSGSYTEPNGPDASREMIRFFLRQEAPTRPQAPTRAPQHVG